MYAIKYKDAYTIFFKIVKLLLHLNFYINIAYLFSCEKKQKLYNMQKESFRHLHFT